MMLRIIEEPRGRIGVCGNLNLSTFTPEVAVTAATELSPVREGSAQTLVPSSSRARSGKAGPAELPGRLRARELAGSTAFEAIIEGFEDERSRRRTTDPSYPGRHSSRVPDFSREAASDMPSELPMRGSVGEAAETCILHAKNDSPDIKRLVVRVSSRNLCRSHAALATILVDAEPRLTQVDLNDSRARLETEVAPGEHAALVAHLVSLHNSAMCIRLGETEFELDLIAQD